MPKLKRVAWVSTEQAVLVSPVAGWTEEVSPYDEAPHYIVVKDPLNPTVNLALGDKF